MPDNDKRKPEWGWMTATAIAWVLGIAFGLLVWYFFADFILSLFVGR